MTSPDQPYLVEAAGSARRDLRRLSGKIAAAIVEFITAPLAGDPQRLSKPLRGEWTAIAQLAEATTGSFSVSTRTSTLWSSSVSGTAPISTGRAEQAQRASVTVNAAGMPMLGPLEYSQSNCAVAQDLSALTFTVRVEQVDILEAVRAAMEASDRG